MVKETLTLIQQMSARSEKHVDGDNDKDDDDNDEDVVSAYERALKLREGVSVQVNILASASQHLIEADVQKQVNAFRNYLFMQMLANILSLYSSIGTKYSLLSV